MHHQPSEKTGEREKERRGDGETNTNSSNTNTNANTNTNTNTNAHKYLTDSCNAPPTIRKHEKTGEIERGENGKQILTPEMRKLALILFGLNLSGPKGQVELSSGHLCF